MTNYELVDNDGDIIPAQETDEERATWQRMLDDADDALTGREEAEDFERGAEDMEHRARRIEAEREADMEAYWSQLEDEAQDGGDL